jgi:hypothetical protein
MPLIATRGGASASGFGFCSGGAWRRVVLRNTSSPPVVTAGGGTIIAYYNTLGFTYRSTDNFVTNSLTSTVTFFNLAYRGAAYAGTQHTYVNTNGFPSISQCDPTTGVVSGASSISGAYGASSNVQTDGSYYYVGVSTNTSGSGDYVIYRSGTTALNFTSPTSEYVTPDFGATQPGVDQIVKFGSDVYATPFLAANGYSIYRRSGGVTWTTLTTFTSSTTFPWMAANNSIIVVIAAEGTTRRIYTSTGSGFVSRLVLTSSTVGALFWGGDAWYAYDSTGLAYTSVNGTTWGQNSINLASGDVLGQGAADGNNKCIPFYNSGASVSGVYVKS